MESCACWVSLNEIGNATLGLDHRQKITDVIHRVAKWEWTGHIAQRSAERWTLEILNLYPRGAVRPPGHPQIRWAD